MLKRLKELAGDSLTYGLSSMLSQLLSLVLVPFYTEQLRPEDYGVLTMSALLLSFFTPVAGLGMDGALFRFYSMSDDPERKYAYFSLATQLKTGAMLLSCLLLLPLYPWLNATFFEGLLSPLQFGLFLATLLFENFSALTIVSLRSERKVRKIATANILTVLASLLLSIWLVLFEKMHVTGALLAGVLGALFRAALYWQESRRHFRWVVFDRELIGHLLGYGLPVLPHKIQAQVIQTFSAFIINHQMGIAAAGLYAVATKIAKPMAFIVSMVQQSWVPFKFHIHKTDADPAHTFKQLITLYWLGILALWGIFSLLTPLLYHWLIDPQYWEGIPYVPFIMSVSVAQGIYFTIITGFELSNRQSLVIRASFLGMVVMIGLSLLTLDFYSPYGLILAQAIAFLLMGAVIYPEAKRVIRIKLPFGFMAFFAAIVTGITAYLYDNESVMARIMGMAGLTAATLLSLSILFPQFSLKNRLSKPSEKTV